MTQPLVVYGMQSPNVRKVVIMLEELGLPYELRHVAVFKGEQFTPEFLEMNPLGKVPVLLDPQLGQPLAESGAILFWLAERSGALLPAAGPDRYEVMQWLMVQMANVGPLFGQLNHFQLLPADSEPYGLGRYAAQAEKLYRLLDERLATREWIAGEAYSIADIATQPWAHYLERHGFDPAAHPNLLRWRNAIDARPAIAAANQRISEAFDDVATRTRRAATKTDLDRFFGRTETVPDADYSSVVRA
ncbi:glutathione S-transferase family protein [Phenylobacterium sp. LjRoot219]|uniref:glutathione S-transferase family protein n=1 Tax=Phenylobacterium sp. LjRoot219 TaxID=3342283 RepID=UPI003ED0B4C8